MLFVFLRLSRIAEPPRAQKPDVGFVTRREARREVGEAVEPHQQVLARLHTELRTSPSQSGRESRDVRRGSRLEGL